MKRNIYTLFILLIGVVSLSSCVRDGNIYGNSNYELIQGRWQFTSVAERTYDEYSGTLYNTYYYPVSYSDYLEFRSNGTVYSNAADNWNQASYYLSNGETRITISGKTYRILELSYSYLTLLLVEYDWVGNTRVRIETTYSLRK